MAEGEACLVFCANMDSNSVVSVYETLQLAEHVELQRNNVRSVGFHMAISPGVEDKCSQEEVLGYIVEVMEQLGYGKQPYAVYRHNDIVREHFHVVSSRVLPNGNVINRHREGFRLNRLQDEMANKYRFFVGTRKERVPTVSTKVTYGEENWAGKAFGIIEHALQYDFRSFREFQAILLGQGVQVNLFQKDPAGLEHVVFRCIDDSGKITSRVLSTEVFEKGFSKRYRAVLAANVSLPQRQGPSVRLQKTVERALNESEGSLATFVDLIARQNLRCAVRRDTKKNHAVVAMTIVDPAKHTLYDAGSLSDRLTVDRLREMDANAPKPKTKEEQIIIRKNKIQIL